MAHLLKIPSKIARKTFGKLAKGAFKIGRKLAKG